MPSVGLGLLRLGAWGVAAFAVAMADPASATVTFSYTSVTSNAFASATDSVGITHSDLEQKDRVSFSLPMTTQEAHAIASVTTDIAAASADEDAISAFADVASGMVSFSGKTTGQVSQIGGLTEAYNSVSYFYYGFKVNQSEVINYTSTVSSSGNYQFDVLNQGTNKFVLIDNIPASGTSSFDIGPGAYTIEIYENYGDGRAQSGVGSVSGAASGQIAFDISAAPEPSTWAIMLVGMAGLGGGLRRARRRATAAA